MKRHLPRGRSMAPGPTDATAVDPMPVPRVRSAASDPGLIADLWRYFAYQLAQSARRLRGSWLWLLLAVAVLHVALLLGLRALMMAPPSPEPSLQTPLELVFIELPPITPPTPPPPPPRRMRAPRMRSTVLQVVELPARAAVTAPASPQSRLQLYGQDGALRLPDTLLDEIDAKFGAERTFDFQVPNLAQAGTFFDRPPPLTFESTRFEQYWKPDQDVVSELLAAAADKLTREIRIPFPGNPNAQVVCVVSVLALGGACGIDINGWNDRVVLNDPNTLNADEARACGALWRKFTAATTQREMLAARDRYDTLCRKPPAVEAAAAAPTAPLQP